ncbi:MAG: hypothetical protein K2L87_04795 [Clostridiales bacterium]|nr:hypothetical protein [Clostridiales bacterium]
MDELEKVLYDLSTKIMKNQKAEAEAVEGYNEQLKLIAAAQDLAVDKELKNFLDELEAATKEKISDELNHGESLYAEYVQMTGIKPATT